MRLYKVIKTKRREVVAKVCDVCQTKYDDDMELQEFTTVYKDCGYASVFGDGNEFLIDICQHCLKKIINNYNIKIDYSGENLD